MTERNNSKIFFDIDMPHVPEGTIAVRLHGKLAFIPERGEGEPLFGKSPFTKRQVDALNTLDREYFNHEQSRVQKRGDRNGYFTGILLD